MAGLGILLALPLAFTAEWLLTRLAGDTVGMQAAPVQCSRCSTSSSCSPQQPGHARGNAGQGQRDAPCPGTGSHADQHADP
ncbi:hypothetical protein AB0K12_46835, partial [Nonomuraea sp. NPDC049419]|uniref:hypothetical protein n=1 Tax=Nonomuraea sp. NPDC049419 TaxID=3155772 RepID=UPI0034423150